MVNVHGKQMCMARCTILGLEIRVQMCPPALTHTFFFFFFFLVKVEPGVVIPGSTCTGKLKAEHSVALLWAVVCKALKMPGRSQSAPPAQHLPTALNTGLPAHGFEITM